MKNCYRCWARPVSNSWICCCIVCSFVKLLVYISTVYSMSLMFVHIPCYPSLDSIQRRSCQIILSSRTYSDACSVLGLPSLHVRRQELSQQLFQQLTRNNNCLHYLISVVRDPSTTDCLRSANKFPVIFARTNRFKNSFIGYGLVNYQWQWLVFYCVIVYCMNVHLL